MRARLGIERTLTLALSRRERGADPHPNPLSPRRLFDPAYREREEDTGKMPVVLKCAIRWWSFRWWLGLGMR